MSQYYVKIYDQHGSSFVLIMDLDRLEDFEAAVTAVTQDEWIIAEGQSDEKKPVPFILKIRKEQIVAFHYWPI